MNPLKIGDIKIEGLCDDPEVLVEIFEKEFIAAMNRSKEWRCLDDKEILNRIIHEWNKPIVLEEGVNEAL